MKNSSNPITSMTRCFQIATLFVAFYVSATSYVSGQIDTPLSPSFAEQPMSLPAPQPALQQNENIDFLTSAPLHEAFAEIPLEAPGANQAIARRPPAAIDELPPEYKPEGNDVQWISGYWSWDEERNDFIWISGIWRDIPPGQRWIPGYWEELENGFRWITGFWIRATLEEMSYLPQPPASIEVGPSYPSPSPDYFYSPGCWVYQTDHYSWQPGYYQPRVENFVWVPPTYVWTPCGYVYRQGFWDRAFDARGVVFAPVYFSQPVYQVAAYRYTPTCVINTDYDLLPHLFVRSNCSHYYFGDWYADRYTNSYCAWSQMNYRPTFQRTYDPLFVYYNTNRFRYNNSSLIGWVDNQYRNCATNANFRPRPTFNINIAIQNNYAGRIPGAGYSGVRSSSYGNVDSDRHADLAETLTDRVSRIANNQTAGGKYQKLSKTERQQIHTAQQPLHRLADDRRNQERELRLTKTSTGSPQRNISTSVKPTKMALPKIDPDNKLARDRAQLDLVNAQKRDNIQRITRQFPTEATKPVRDAQLNRDSNSSPSNRGVTNQKPVMKQREPIANQVPAQNGNAKNSDSNRASGRTIRDPVVNRDPVLIQSTPRQSYPTIDSIAKKDLEKRRQDIISAQKQQAVEKIPQREAKQQTQAQKQNLEAKDQVKQGRVASAQQGQQRTLINNDKRSVESLQGSQNQALQQQKSQLDAARRLAGKTVNENSRQQRQAATQQKIQQQQATRAQSRTQSNTQSRPQKSSKRDK